MWGLLTTLRRLIGIVRENGGNEIGTTFTRSYSFEPLCLVTAGAQYGAYFKVIFCVRLDGLQLTLLGRFVRWRARSTAGE